MIRAIGGVVLVGLITGAGWTTGFAQANGPGPASNEGERRERYALTLQEMRERVLSKNEQVQMQMLEVEMRRRASKAEYGIFEPQVVGGVDHVETERENNAQQTRSLLTPMLIERNTIYNGGLEVLTPIGTRIQTGYTLRDLSNNLGGSIFGGGTGGRVHEYESFAGISMTQPLLKNGWMTATMARIRLAALASDMAFQEYRRQLMLVLSRAEAAYWEMYQLQEQERITTESMRAAREILRDSQTRAEVGKASELDVLEAQSGLALRSSRWKQSQLNRLEGANQLATLYSSSILDEEGAVEVVDEPEAIDPGISLFEAFDTAFELNPDWLTRLTALKQEEIRVAYAKNQRLPQLDLKGSYGFNGLGQTPGESLDDIDDADFPAWSVGVELRVPVLGGIRERNELAAARLSRKSAYLGLQEAQVQIGNAIESALQRVQIFRDNIGSYREVVDFHERLLETQLARLEVGQAEMRTVLETEEKLFEARLGVVESLVQYQKALLELQLVTGSLLESRHVDLTREQLEARTLVALETSEWSDRELAKASRDFLADYEGRLRNRGSRLESVIPGRPQTEAGESQSGTGQVDEPRRMDPAAQERAMEALRQELEKPRQGQ